MAESLPFGDDGFDLDNKPSAEDESVGPGGASADVPSPQKKVPPFLKPSCASDRFIYLRSLKLMKRFVGQRRRTHGGSESCREDDGRIS